MRDWRMIGRISSRLLLAGVVLAVSGCGGAPEPRRLGLPQLDLVTLFPEAVQGVPVGAETTSFQAVPLSGRLVGKLPLGSGEWRWATDGDVTLILHSSSGAPPDVLVYAEAFSDLIAERPSHELQRFQLTVDPVLSEHRLPWTSGTSALAGPLARGTSATPAQARDLAERATTRTAGRGLGYRSSPETFTGWKWVGENAHQISWRLGRTSGRWEGQSGLDPKLQEALQAITSRPSTLQRLERSLAGEGPETAPSGSALPARLVLGSATAQDDLGIHFAVLCLGLHCSVAPQVARFIDSVRTAEPAEIRQLAGEVTFADLSRLAGELGIHLLALEDLLKPTELQPQVLNRPNAPHQ